MDLDSLLLQKTEIPILGQNLFQVPIYPWLLDSRIRIDPELANKVFPSVAREWYDDFFKYVAALTDKERKGWFMDVFCSKPPSIVEENGHQTIYPGGIWTDLVGTEQSGFASTLSINRDVGGTLFIHPRRENQGFLMKRYIRFNPDKFVAYASPDPEGRNSLPPGVNGAKGFSYEHDNIDHEAGAYFLRNWAIIYHNEALKASWCAIKALQKANETLQIVGEK